MMLRGGRRERREIQIPQLWLRSHCALSRAAGPNLDQLGPAPQLCCLHSGHLRCILCRALLPARLLLCQAAAAAATAATAAAIAIAAAAVTTAVQLLQHLNSKVAPLGMRCLQLDPPLCAAGVPLPAAGVQRRHTVDLRCQLLALQGQRLQAAQQHHASGSLRAAMQVEHKQLAQLEPTLLLCRLCCCHAVLPRRSRACGCPFAALLAARQAQRRTACLAAPADAVKLKRRLPVLVQAVGWPLRTSALVCIRCRSAARCVTAAALAILLHRRCRRITSLVLDLPGLSHHLCSQGGVRTKCQRQRALGAVVRDCSWTRVRGRGVRTRWNRGVRAQAGSGCRVSRTQHRHGWGMLHTAQHSSSIQRYAPGQPNTVTPTPINPPPSLPAPTPESSIFSHAAYAASTLPARPYAPSNAFHTATLGCTPACRGRRGGGRAWWVVI